MPSQLMDSYLEFDDRNQDASSIAKKIYIYKHGNNHFNESRNDDLGITNFNVFIIIRILIRRFFPSPFNLLP